MIEIKCKIGGANCKGSISLSAESVAPHATYTCSQCNEKPAQTVHFQETSFDRDLRRVRKPTGTEHIKRQGEPVDTKDTLEIWSQQQEATKTKGRV